MGCYTDNASQRDLPGNSGVPLSYSNQNVEECIVTCITNNFAYSGIAYASPSA